MIALTNRHVSYALVLVAALVPIASIAQMPGPGPQ